MPQVISALDARTQFGQLMRRAKDNGTRFVVDKRGEPQVVIMGISDFIETIAPESDILASIRKQAKRSSAAKLSMQNIDQEIKAYRQTKKR